MTRPPGRHLIREALWPFAVPIGDMAEHPDNPNEGDDDELAESLEVNGQFRCILRWVELPDGAPMDPPLVLAGHTTRRAAMSLGWEWIAAEPFIGSSDEALRAMLADNRYARKARMNPAAEVDALRQLDDWRGTGYTDLEVQRLAAKLDEPLSFPPDGLAPIPGPTGARQCSRCGHRCLTVHT